MSDDKPTALTEDMVRKLLQMNPHLRGEGQSTRDVLAGTQKAVAGAPAPAPAAKPKDADLDGLLGRLTREHGAWQVEQRKQQEALTKQGQELESSERTSRSTAGELVIAAFLDSDAALARPESKEVLATEKAFLTKVGFSVEKLLAAKRKQGR